MDRKTENPVTNNLVNPSNPVNRVNRVQTKGAINALTHRIIGCAMQVYNTLGNGFQELVYQKSLAVELVFQKLAFEREKVMPIFYRGTHVGTRRVDFFVESQIMVELKAVEKIEDVHKAQAINYLEAFNIADGLLINFGARSLEFKRLYNKALVNPNKQMPEHN